MIDHKSYLHRTKATKRAANRVRAIEKNLLAVRAEQCQLDGELEGIIQRSAGDESRRRAVSSDDVSVFPPKRVSGDKSLTRRLGRIGKRHDRLLGERAALGRELALLNASLAEREAVKSPPEGRRYRRCRARPETAPDGSSTGPTSAGIAEECTGPIKIDWELCLWGEPADRGRGLNPIPVFDDPLLDRIADIFRQPGLPHFMVAQLELQIVFDDFDGFVAGRDRSFDGLAFSDALADCEIDLAVADELLRGGWDRAARLRDVAAVHPAED